MMIGTRPSDESHPFAIALRDADYCQTHAAGPDDPPFQVRTWRKANPSLSHMPDLLKAIRREAKAAKRDGSLLQQFRSLRLNQGVSDVSVNVLIEAETWKAIEGVASPEGAPIWGIDLGTSAAQSAIAAFWPTSGRLACIAAFPSEPSLAERGLRDGIGGAYVDMHRRGELLQCGGAAVDIAELVRAAMQRFGCPSVVVADRWRDAELRDSLQAAGVPMTGLELRGQGFRDGAEDVRSFRRACAEGKVTPVPSLLLRSAMREARHG